MTTVTAKQLHQETKSILDPLGRGEPMVITRNGRPVARLEPMSSTQPLPWEEVMAEVWQAQAQIKPADRVPNPVLKERKRRRR
jgi:antitoxin (DNA-binding transcriptional repressor) of toxin-antitoxin stability system